MDGFLFASRRQMAKAKVMRLPELKPIFAAAALQA
jgi:hypothetical protein